MTALMACACLVLAIAGGCSVTLSPQPPASTPADTHWLTGWPPMPNVGPAPGVSLAVADDVVVLSNNSSRTYSLSPPMIEIWEGGAPWVEIGDPGGGSVKLEPGAKVTRQLPNHSTAIRVGARLWEPDGHGDPWFTWLEISAN